MNGRERGRSVGGPAMFVVIALFGLFVLMVLFGFSPVAFLFR